MRADLEDLLNLDRLVHEPARLVILTVLAEVVICSLPVQGLRQPP